jgi:hypothetical protein
MKLGLMQLKQTKHVYLGCCVFKRARAGRAYVTYLTGSVNSELVLENMKHSLLDQPDVLILKTGKKLNVAGQVKKWCFSWRKTAFFESIYLKVIFSRR